MFSPSTQAKQDKLADTIQQTHRLTFQQLTQRLQARGSIYAGISGVIVLGVNQSAIISHLSQSRVLLSELTVDQIVEVR
jgi:hypothetical protein